MSGAGQVGGGVNDESLSSGSRQRVWQWVGLQVRAGEEHNPTLTAVLTHELCGLFLKRYMSCFD